MYLDLVFASFLVLQGYDFYSTHKALKGRKRKESNPILKAIMDKVGSTPTLLIKTTLTCGAGAWLYSLAQIEVLMGLVVFYGYFMYSNYKVLNP